MSITNLVQDPVHSILNANQNQYYDGTIVKTEVITNYKFNEISDAEYKTYNFSFNTQNYVPLKSMVLQIPISLTYYGSRNPLQNEFENWAWADNAMFQPIYQLEITIGDTIIQRGSTSLRRVYKCLLNNGKSDDDTDRIKGLWGLPINKSDTFEQYQFFLQTVVGDLAWIQNHIAQRDSYLTLLRSIDSKFNGSPPVLYTTVGVEQVDVYEHQGLVNLPLPFAMISDLFNQNARLPPNIRIGITLRTYNQPQILGIIPTLFRSTPIPQRKHYGWLLGQVGQEPILYYESDTLANPVLDLIKEWRLGNNLKYNFSDYEERMILERGPAFSVALTVQQQYPTEIILRLISTQNSFYSDKDPIIGENGKLVTVANDLAVFPDSLCSPNYVFNVGPDEGVIRGNKLADLRFLSGGEIVYQYLSENDSLRYGNIVPSAQDWIYANYNLKNSDIIKKSNIGELKETTKPFTCTAYNAEFRLIYTPGGYLQKDKNASILDAINLTLQFSMQTELPAYCRFQIILRKAAQLHISALNQTKLVTWPDLSKDNQVYEITPSFNT